MYSSTTNSIIKEDELFKLLENTFVHTSFVICSWSGEEKRNLSNRLSVLFKDQTKADKDIDFSNEIYNVLSHFKIIRGHLDFVPLNKLIAKIQNETKGFYRNNFIQETKFFNMNEMLNNGAILKVFDGNSGDVDPIVKKFCECEKEAIQIYTTKMNLVKGIKEIAADFPKEEYEKPFQLGDFCFEFVVRESSLDNSVNLRANILDKIVILDPFCSVESLEKIQELFAEHVKSLNNSKFKSTCEERGFVAVLEERKSSCNSQRDL